MSTNHHRYKLWEKDRAVAQGFGQLMKVRVWYQKGVGSGLEKAHDKGEYGDDVGNVNGKLR